MGQFEDLKIRRMSELDKLPWFEKDGEGRLRLKAGAGIGPVIDTHAHVGWAFVGGTSVDMARQCPVDYFFDYECRQNILFEDKHPWPLEALEMAADIARLVLVTPQRNMTMTAANLAEEMGRMGIGKVYLQPLAVPGGEGRHVEDSFRATTVDPRIESVGAVYPKPRGPDVVAELERQISEHGIKAIKYHPVFQFLPPNDKNVDKLFEWCEANDMLVYAHTGYTGSELPFMQDSSKLKWFKKALENHRNLRMVFAHAGLKEFRQALDVAMQFDDRVWLEISGQPVGRIKTVLEVYDTEKVLFGSDWPFYPLAVALARGLVATEDCQDLRPKLFCENAKRLFGLA